MSTHYQIEAVTVDAGLVHKIDEPAAQYYTYNSCIQEILWPILEHMEPAFGHDPFPWFEASSMFDGSDGATPGPQHCLKPHDVLQDVHWIEREVKGHPRRYPAVWSFLVPSSSGPPIAYQTLDAHFKGRAVRLYGEGKDCWARETAPGPREGIHHELTKEEVVLVELEPGGPPVEVRIVRAPMSSHYPEVMDGIKRVCAFAVQQGALVLAQYIH